MNIIKAEQGKNFTLLFKEDKPGYYTFKCPLTNVLIKVSIGKSEELKERFHLNLELGTYDAIVFEAKGKVYLDYNKVKLDTGVIVHESIHIVNNIYKLIGQELDIGNDELQAYYTQMIYNVVLEIIKDFNKQNKK